MKHTTDGVTYAIRLDKGEWLIDNLLKFIKSKNIRGGTISGIGGLEWAEIGFYDLTAKAYAWTRFEEPLELLALNGNVSWLGDKPFLHLHASVSDASQYARGGHLNEASANGTVEIFITEWKNKKGLTRAYDKQTGLNLLQL